MLSRETVVNDLMHQLAARRRLALEGTPRTYVFIAHARAIMAESSPAEPRAYLDNPERATRIRRAAA